MTLFHCMAAAALLMAGLSCAILPFIAVWDRHLAVVRRRSLYDKSAGQTDSLTALLNILFAAAIGADLLMAGYIDSLMVGPWRLLWEAMVMSSAFAALSAVIVLYARRGMRNAFSALSGVAAAASASLCCVLVWAFYLGALKESPAGLEAAQQAFVVVLAGIQSVGFMLYVTFAVALALTSAYGLALCWHILLRGRDDFGRDYYTFTLGMRSRQAAYAGILLLPVSAVQFWMYPQVAKEWALELLPFAGEYAELALSGGMLCLPASVLLWYSMSRASVPMQKRSFAFFAMIFLTVGVYCALGRI